MAATAVVISQEMEVVAGDVEAGGVLWAPKARQGAADVVAAHHRLILGGFQQAHALGHLGDAAHQHLVKQASDADRHKQIGAGAFGIELGAKGFDAVDGAEAEVLLGFEVGGHPKGNALISWGAADAAIGPRLPADPIEQDPFAIELLKGADAEVAMVSEIFHLQAAAKHALHHRC